jgi:hypothetical protein
MASVFLLLTAARLNAQVQTNTQTASGQATKTVQVERGEVVLVSGNDLIVKMEDGTIRHIANVPESARVNVNGQSLGIHDLKPGMKLERTITTTSTPKIITTTKSVTGTVVQVTPPLAVTLRLDDNSVQRFNIPKGQKFNIDGQDVDAFGLKPGMKISATKVVEEPVTSVSVMKNTTGTMPPPPPPPDVPVLVAVMVPAPAPAAAPAAAAPAEAPPAKLPKTASLVPLIGALGVLFSCVALALGVVRRIRPV